MGNKNNFIKISIIVLLVSFVFLPTQASAKTKAGITPNSFFYFLDTSFEEINIFFTFNSEKKAQKALEYAEERIAEIEEIASLDNPKGINKAIVNYEKKILLAKELAVPENIAKHQEVLERVLEKAPDETKEIILKVIKREKQKQDKVSQLDKTPVVRFMKQGAEGEDVCILQKILKLEGVFDNSETCYYGSVTHWAVSRLVGKYGYFQTPDNFGTIDKTAMFVINQLYTIDENGSIQKNLAVNIKLVEPAPQDYSHKKITGLSLAETMVADDKEEINFDKYKIADEAEKDVSENNDKDYEEEFQDFSNEAEEIINRLEKDKDNFQLLKDTVDSNRSKVIEHAENLMDSWAETAGEISLSVPSEYRTILEIKKDWIIADKESLSNSINWYFDIVDLYFTNFNGRDYRTIITEDQDILRKCMALDISEWVNDSRLNCIVSLDMTLGDSKSYAEDFIIITNKLVEIEDIAFDEIEKKTRDAEDDIASELEHISKSIGIMQSIKDNYNKANLQSEYLYNTTQTSLNLQSVKCYTRTNDSIFDENRTYDTTCEPYTQTVEEKCALQKARSVSNSSIYVHGTIDPECK